jgi:MFS family permease
MPFGQIWHLSPVGLAGGFGAGVANGAVFAMGPVYGIAVGMSVTRVSLLMACMIFGEVVLQWPIGAWSDRVPRRRAIVAINPVAVGSAVLLTQLDPTSLWPFVAIFVLGGSTFPVYALSLSHLNDVLEPQQTIAASSVFVLVWGIGSTIGPILASVLMANTDPVGLFRVMAGTHLAVAVYTAFRVIVRDGPAVSDQKHYLTIPARASGLIGLFTRSRRNQTN